MKKLLSILAIVGIFFSLNADAQNAKNTKKAKQGKKVEKIYVSGTAKASKYKSNSDAIALDYTNKLTRKLTLSTAQRNQIHQINTQSASKIQEIQRQGMNGTDLKSAIKGEYYTRTTAIRSVLDATQMKRFDTMRATIKAMKSGAAQK